MNSQENLQTSLSTWASTSISGRVGHLLSALESGITVSLIATFDLKTCAASDKVADVLNRQDLKPFDYIPVMEMDSQSVVGVLVKHECKEKSDVVQEVMEKLHESILISADASLLAFVAEADKTPFCLVLQGRKITGLVTLSDLQKLAVRPMLFSLITCVELLLAEWLRQRYPNDQDWLEKLSEGRREKVDEKWQKLQHRNMAIDRITTTDFCDKRDAALKLDAFPDNKNNKKLRERQLKDIEKLRDTVAHAGDYALTPENARKVAQTVREALEIITFLEKSLTVQIAS